MFEVCTKFKIYWICPKFAVELKETHKIDWTLIYNLLSGLRNKKETAKPAALGCN